MQPLYLAKMKINLGMIPNNFVFQTDWDLIFEIVNQLGDGTDLRLDLPQYFTDSPDLNNNFKFKLMNLNSAAIEIKCYISYSATSTFLKSVQNVLLDLQIEPP